MLLDSKPPTVARVDFGVPKPSAVVSHSYRLVVTCGTRNIASSAHLFLLVLTKWANTRYHRAFRTRVVPNTSCGTTLGFLRLILDALGVKFGAFFDRLTLEIDDGLALFPTHLANPRRR